MKFIKKNFKTIIAFVMGIVLASGACIYAAYKYNSTDVVYEKQDGTEIAVNEALDELYKKKNDIVLVGHGEKEFSSSETTETAIPSTVDDSSILQVSNNIFTAKKAGKYMIAYTVGSNNENQQGNDYSAWTKLYINNSVISCKDGTGGLHAWCSSYDFDYYIADLNVNDTIKVNYRGNGSDHPKKSLYKVYYIKNSEDTDVVNDNYLYFPTTPAVQLGTTGSTQSAKWDKSYTMQKDAYIMVVTYTGSSGGNNTYIYKNGTTITPNYLYGGSNGDTGSRTGIWFINCQAGDVIRFYSECRTSGYTSGHTCDLFFNNN